MVRRTLTDVEYPGLPGRTFDSGTVEQQLFRAAAEQIEIANIRSC